VITANPPIEAPINNPGKPPTAPPITANANTGHILFAPAQKARIQQSNAEALDSGACSCTMLASLLGGCTAPWGLDALPCSEIEVCMSNLLKFKHFLDCAVLAAKK
jgi:hypothetical protein